MHKEFILGVEAFEYNIVIYQYNAIKGRSSSMSELHILLSLVCLCSIFCYFFFTCSHFCLLPVVLNLCMSVIFSVSLSLWLSMPSNLRYCIVCSAFWFALRWIPQFTEIREFSLNFCSGTWKCSVFMFSPKRFVIRTITHKHTHARIYPLYINRAHLLTNGHSLRYSFNAQI